MTDKEYILELELKISLQSQRIEDLEGKILLLMDLVQKQGVKKDSHNSSMPPASDFVSKNRSLREPSDKKSGGQQGHKGTTLFQTAAPDEVITLKNEVCTFCGTPLNDVVQVLRVKRQVIDIPPIQTIVKEYQQFSCQCPHCQTDQMAEFPKGVNAPVQYGASIESLVSYFSVHQVVPFARLKEIFGSVFGLNLSEGSIDNILKRCSKKCDLVVERIKSALCKSKVVGSDETGMKVNGKKGWMWAWQNADNTLVICSDNRGCKTINDIWANGFVNATHISDRWAAQLKVHAKGHQVCLVHLLRDLTYLEELEGHYFATQFKELIKEIFKLKHKSLEKNQAFWIGSNEIKDLQKKLKALLIVDINRTKQHKTSNFQKSMIKCQNYLMPCLLNLEVPPDNNASERAIRKIKIKQKISGQFKSGQDAFCRLSSVIGTLIKRKKNILLLLNQIYLTT